MLHPSGDAEPPAALAGAPQEDAPPPLLRRYVRWLRRYRALVVLFWLAVLSVGIIGIFNTFRSLKGEVRAHAATAPAGAAVGPGSWGVARPEYRPAPARTDQGNPGRRQ